MTAIRKDYPQQRTHARFMPETLVRDSEKSTTVDLTWSTGAQVRRYDLWDDEEFIEELSMNEGEVDLSRLNSGAPVLRDHDNSIESVVGVVERAWLENGEGRATIRFSDRADVSALVNDVESGIIRNISVGYQVRTFQKTVPETGLPVYRAIDWLPMELSLVAVPADAAAQIRKSDSLTSVEIRSNNMTDPVNQDAADQNDTVNPDKTEVSTEELSRKAVLAERKRIADIRTFGAKAGASESTIEKMVTDGIAATEAREQMIEEWAKKVDSTSSRGHVEVTEDETDKRRDAAINAILGRSGLIVDAKERTEKLQGNPFVGFKMLDIARDCAERTGIKTSGMSQMDVVGRAFTQSSSDFPVILENTMHKALLGAYATAPDTWRRFVRIGSVSDFRAWKRLKSGSIGNLDSLSELGEFKNKSIPDGESESVQAGTKGNLINVSRQAIVNDDLGYFLGLTADLGRAAARTIEAAVYAKLVANGALSDGVALFHADHGNLAGTGAAMSVETVDAGRVAMASQQDINGNDYLDIRPSILLCPIGVGGTARVLINSVYDPDATSKLQRPNMVNGIVSDIIDSPRLTGNAWYLLSNPADAPVIEVVFLDGADSPFLDMQDGFSVDGVRYKVRLDFGVGVVDYRGAYKNAGA